MKRFRPWLVALACGLSCNLPAFAASPLSGPGMMRCAVVSSRLSSADDADRAPILSWVQGYLSGIAAVATAFDGTSDVQVPLYGELRSRILAQCDAEPTADLFHVARRLSGGRRVQP